MSARPATAEVPARCERADSSAQADNPLFLSGWKSLSLAGLRFVRLTEDELHVDQRRRRRGVSYRTLEPVADAALEAFPWETAPRRALRGRRGRDGMVLRDLGWPAKPLESAETVLGRHGDLANAAHARYLASGACS
jgi:hypothetical protein